MEMSESLQMAGIKTTIFHRGTLPANRWDDELSKVMLKELKINGVEFIANAETLAIEEGKNAHLGVVANKGKWEADLILLAVGVKPNVRLAQAMGLTIGKTGAIAVNSSQQTSLENVYAVGDCCESYHRVSRRWVNIPLGDIANKQGRDDRGQDGMIAQTISKAIKEELGLDEKARGPIIGNYIDWDSQGQSSGNSWASKVQPAKAFQNRTPDPITDDSDDSVIPF